MKATSTKTLHFPQFEWGIHAGETRDLPEDKDAEKAILDNPAITKVSGKKEDSSTITSTKLSDNKN